LTLKKQIWAGIFIIPTVQLHKWAQRYRCFAICFHKKIFDKKVFIRNIAGVIKPEEIDSNLVKVNMELCFGKKKFVLGDKKEITVLIKRLKSTMFLWKYSLCNNYGGSLWNWLKNTALY
jgi:hypothetical protein